MVGRHLSLFLFGIFIQRCALFPIAILYNIFQAIQTKWMAGKRMASLNDFIKAFYILFSDIQLWH